MLISEMIFLHVVLHEPPLKLGTVEDLFAMLQHLGWLQVMSIMFDLLTYPETTL